MKKKIKNLSLITLLLLSTACTSVVISVDVETKDDVDVQALLGETNKVLTDGEKTLFKASLK